MMQDHLDIIETSIVKGVSDSAPATRANARQCFAAFTIQWPDRAERLVKSLDPSVLKMITGTPPKKSSKNDFKTFLKEKKIVSPKLQAESEEKRTETGEGIEKSDKLE